MKTQLLFLLSLIYGACAMLFGAELAAPDGFPMLPPDDYEGDTNGLPSVTISLQSITVAWNANSETNLAGYNVYWGTNSRSYSEKLFTTETNALVFVIPGTTNFIAVTATNMAGLESPFSAEIWVNGDMGEFSQVTNIVTIHAQAATSAAGPWVDVGSVTVTNNATRQFFRLKLVK